MIQQGRKSVAALAVSSAVPSVRPPPPKTLTRRQAALWRGIVATKPDDWWSADSFPLLVAYCRHVDTADLIAERINQMDVLDDRLEQLLKLRQTETGAIGKLATQMRLTQQARYRGEVASTIHRQTASANAVKPWAI